MSINITSVGILALVSRHAGRIFSASYSAGCPTTDQTRQLFNNLTTNEGIAQQLGAHYRHIRLHFSPTNVLPFKFRCNILICFGIIKELPGFVGSGIPCIIICGLSGCIIFATLSHKRQDFLGKMLNIKCVFWFFLELLSAIFLTIRRNQRDIIVDVHMSPSKVSLILAIFEKKKLF
jgi:hypothetical protein